MGDFGQQLFLLTGTGAMLIITGFYCILVSRNLIRTLIGIELLSKAITLFIIIAGYMTNRTALAQSIAITFIILEVVVMVVGALVIGVTARALHQRTRITRH